MLIVGSILNKIKRETSPNFNSDHHHHCHLQLSHHLISPAQFSLHGSSSSDLVTIWNGTGDTPSRNALTPIIIRVVIKEGNLANNLQRALRLQRRSIKYYANLEKSVVSLGKVVG
ncbi:hypothetical protein QVD17_10157 [Tagetes erecta]|uniref:Uncharacterized protein n=1 Tax=Tagetes erecta TaxID=13708 RepID=A0AAD8P4K1_TARER|nr:hypothetical protein QVD17_10157 [Tagetes erecta]